MNYTDLQVQVIKALFASSRGNGHDFGCLEDVKVSGLNRKALGGVITSLQNAGFFDYVEAPLKMDGYYVTQFKIADVAAAEKVANA